MRYLTDAELKDALATTTEPTALRALVELHDRREAAKPRCFYCKRVNDTTKVACSKCQAHYRKREGHEHR